MGTSGEKVNVSDIEDNCVLYSGNFTYSTFDIV